MPTSTSTVFCRVNRRHPCRICGKPDWCSYTTENMQISICMRIKTGARKINAQGGAIFIHGDGSVPSRIIVNPVKAPLAPIEIRDTLYSQLINVSPATHFRRLFITGENGLLTRGLNKRHLGNYGGLPAEWRERPPRAPNSEGIK